MYGKLFAQTFTGSLVGAGAHVFAVLAYAVACADANDAVELNPRFLAAMLGEPIERVAEAIAYLESPDPESRTRDLDGRRIQRMDGSLFRVVNRSKFRDVRGVSDLREYNRLRMAAYRKRKKGIDAPMPRVADFVPEDEALPPIPLRAGGAYPPTVAVPYGLDEVIAECAHNGYTIDPMAFYSKMSANNWRYSNGAPVRNWRRLLRTWDMNKRQETFRRQEGNPNEKVVLVPQNEMLRVALAEAEADIARLEASRDDTQEEEEDIA